MIDGNVFVRNTDVMQNLTKKILIINISIAYQFHLPYFINYGLFNEMKNEKIILFEFFKFLCRWIGGGYAL